MSPMPVGWKPGDEIIVPKAPKKVSQKDSKKSKNDNSATAAGDAYEISPRAIDLDMTPRPVDYNMTPHPIDYNEISPMAVPVSPAPGGGFPSKPMSKPSTTSQKQKQVAAPQEANEAPYEISPHAADLDLTPRPLDYDMTPRPIDLDMTPHPIDYNMTPHPIDLDLTPRPIDYDMTPHPVDLNTPPHSLDFLMTPQPIDYDGMSPMPLQERPPRPQGGISGFFARLGFGSSTTTTTTRTTTTTNTTTPPTKEKEDKQYMSPQHHPHNMPLQQQQQQPQQIMPFQERRTKHEEEAKNPREKDLHGKDAQFFKNLDEKIYEVDEGQIQSYRKNGFVKLRSVASGEEIRVLEIAIDRVMIDQASRISHPGKLNNLWKLSDDVAIQSFVFSKRIAKIVAELMGVAAVRLYHDQLLMKRSVDKTSWHQDASYWPFEDQTKVIRPLPLPSPLLLSANNNSFDKIRW